MKRNKIAVLAFLFFVVFKMYGEQPELINEESTFVSDYTENLNHNGIEIANVNDIKFFLGLHTVARFQAITQENVFVLSDGEFVEPVKLGAGAQTSFANLEFRINLSDDIVVFFDGLLATQRHPTRWWGGNGYIYFRRMPENSFLSTFNGIFNYIDLKVGNFNADFGDEWYRRSMNGDVQRNPLVGTPVVSTMGTEPGFEIIHKRPRYGLMVGAGTGAPEQDMADDRNYSFRSKAWVSPFQNMYVSGSFYTTDHGAGVARGTNLFRRERLGGSYASVWNFHNDGSGGGEGPGQVRIGDGKELDAFQFDLTWRPIPTTHFKAHYGLANASGPNPVFNTDVGTEEWSYYGADITQYVHPSVYLAARYSEADASSFGDVAAGSVNRLQIGAGAWITDGMLLKLEYVSQAASGWDEGTVGVANFVDVGRDPKFSGIIFEASFSL